MSIIIKGIDLPKEGETAIVLAIDIDESVMKMQHHEWHCTDIQAIQIPKGARLIDANKLMEEVNIEINEYMLTEKGMRSLIKNAPTILESEEKE